MRKTIFVNNHFYHIYNRGVDKRDIFTDENDYFRFTHYLYELNNLNSSSNLGRNFQRQIEGGRTSFRDFSKRKRELLVNILCFCLMPNHIHLILEQIREGGISKFMQKLGTAHTMYFNSKNKRTGVLFQGPFKSLLIINDEYLIHLSRYIHLNPLELIDPQWKEKEIENWQKINEFLERFRWSSFPDYMDKRNFPSVTNREFIFRYFGERRKYKKFVNEWLAKDLETLRELINE